MALFGTLIGAPMVRQKLAPKANDVLLPPATLLGASAYGLASDAARRRRKQAVGQGRQSTMLTGPMGLPMVPLGRARATLGGGGA